MNTDFNRVIQKLCTAAISAALLTSPAIARDTPTPLGSARQTKTDVAGLNATAQILVDVWGIPHIYAGNEHDLFFLQGFNAARDRLGKSISGASGDSACSPRISVRPMPSRTRRCGCFSIAAT